MSRAYLSYLGNLFDSEEHSDCTINFCIDIDGPPAPKRPRTRKSTAQNQADAGRTRVEALPAHLLVLCGGSDHLASLYKQWCDEHRGPRAAATAAHPEFTLTLSSASELPHARAALRFIYTGKLTNHRSASAAELLQIRRQAAHLRIPGCVERCDEALAARATTTAGVIELHSCRHLLPPPFTVPASAASAFATGQTDPFSAGTAAAMTTALLTTCRKQLTRNCGAYLATLQPCALGELLAWLFPDAPSVLSDPGVRRQLQALPAPALEALLLCESFATDDEASVLLMLAYWLAENNSTASKEERVRLCRLIRLSNLNSAYLHGLLPRISWFPIPKEEHQFLCLCVAEGNARRSKLLAAATAAGKHDCACQWYTAPPRPVRRADAGMPYGWSIRQEDIAIDLDLASQKLPGGLTGEFANGAARLVAQGFEWYPGTLWFNNDGLPEAVLCCSVPAPLAPFTSAKDVVGVASVAAEATVYRWRQAGPRCGGGARCEEATRKTYGRDDVMSVTGGPAPAGLGWRLALFGKGIEKAPGAAAKLMPELTQYFHDGKLSGAITFTAP